MDPNNTEEPQTGDETTEAAVGGEGPAEVADPNEAAPDVIPDEDAAQTESSEGAEKPEKAKKNRRKHRLVKPAVVDATRTQDEARAMLNEARQERNTTLVTLDASKARLRELLKKQKGLPPLTKDEVEHATYVPNAFPPEIQALIDKRQFQFLWAKDPEGSHVTESDRGVAALHLRAMGGPGIYDILTQGAIAGLPPHLFNADGVHQSRDQILAYAPWDIWEAKRARERHLGDTKLQASKEGMDEEGAIPGVTPTNELMGDVRELSGQPGADAPVWEDVSVQG